MPAATGLRAMRLAIATSVSCLVACNTPVHAIEMFTYFGDGSRIGLPSLEVPIEAYPGIPLRSDRIRARRAGQPVPQGTIGRFRGRGITIRVPAPQQPAIVNTRAAGPTGPAAVATATDVSGDVSPVTALSEETRAEESEASESLDLSGFRVFDKELPHAEPGRDIKQSGE